MNPALIAAFTSVLSDSKTVKNLKKTFGNLAGIDGKKLKEGVQKIKNIGNIQMPFEVAIANITAQINAEAADQLAETTESLMTLLSSNAVQGAIHTISTLINRILEAMEDIADAIAGTPDWEPEDYV